MVDPRETRAREGMAGARRSPQTRTVESGAKAVRSREAVRGVRGEVGRRSCS